MKRRVLLIALAIAAVAAAPSAGLKPTAPAPPSLTPLGSIKSGPFRSEDPRIAEINAYDAAGRRVFVVNPLDSRLDVIDISNPAAPVSRAPVVIVDDCQATLRAACPLATGGEPNSVAIHGRLMAIAYANVVRTDPGHAVLYWLWPGSAPQFLTAVQVGALPDMITFSEEGRFVLTANEGEPSADYSIDPPGSVTTIDLLKLVVGWPWGAVRHVGFEAFDAPAKRARLESEGVRIFGPGASVSQDLEPEYIAVDGGKVYVTLQENNALAILDLYAGKVERIVALGLKDHAKPGQGLDPSDQDAGISIANWPVSGMYQPDAIHAFSVKGRTYLVTANEGDAREYAAFVEAVRVGNSAYVLDPTVFPNAAALKANAALGRLTVSRASGDLDGDGDFDRIDVFGARSISIRDSEGRLVWDSGDLLERLSARLDGTSTLFNTTNTANARDNRSDDKSIEPESVVVGEVKGRPYAFVGLERDSGIAVFDLSNPAAPVLVAYANNRRFPSDPSTGAFLPCNDTNDCGDLGPEGLTFVPAKQSPTRAPLLIVSNEASSTTTVWEIR